MASTDSKKRNNELREIIRKNKEAWGLNNWIFSHVIKYHNNSRLSNWMSKRSDCDGYRANLTDDEMNRLDEYIKWSDAEKMAFNEKYANERFPQQQPKNNGKRTITTVEKKKNDDSKKRSITTVEKNDDSDEYVEFMAKKRRKHEFSNNKIVVQSDDEATEYEDENELYATPVQMPKTSLQFPAFNSSRQQLPQPVMQSVQQHTPILPPIKALEGIVGVPKPVHISETRDAPRSAFKKQPDSVKVENVEALIKLYKNEFFTKEQFIQNITNMINYNYIKSIACIGYNFINEMAC